MNSPSCCSLTSYCAEFINSSFYFSIILLLLRVYEQPLMLQPDLFVVHILWVASSAAARSFLCRVYEQPLLLQHNLFPMQILWTAPPAAAWPIFTVQSLWTAPPAAAWPYLYCAEFMNSPSCCSITFFLCRFYEQSLLLQPDLIFTVQSLWTAPPAAAWPFFTAQSLWTAPSAATWTIRPGTRGSHPCQPKTQG